MYWQMMKTMVAAFVVFIGGLLVVDWVEVGMRHIDRPAPVPVVSQVPDPGVRPVVAR